MNAHAFTYHLIGIGDQSVPELSREALTLISQNTVFSGGKRHFERVKFFLPKGYTWIMIRGKMEQLMGQYAEMETDVIIFTSGDPFFYGFGNTLQRLAPKVKLNALPYFNSLQRLCHKTQTNYNELRAVSVHGRKWDALDHALIEDAPLIGVLTDGEKTPAAIAQRMLQYGFTHYQMTVGENLDGVAEKLYAKRAIEECIAIENAPLNCVLLHRKQARFKPFGLAEKDFVLLDGRVKMITKMAVRLATISALNLQEKEIFWDIGSCTGSVAIEAKRHYPRVEIIAFEKRTACEEIIQLNKERFSTPGIKIVIADFFDLELNQFPKPDVVFIGGHGNRLAEMIDRVSTINPKARIVTNAVLESSQKTFTQSVVEKGYELQQQSIQVDDHHTIQILSAQEKISTLQEELL